MRTVPQPPASQRLFTVGLQPPATLRPLDPTGVPQIACSAAALVVGARGAYGSPVRCASSAEAWTGPIESRWLVRERPEDAARRPRLLDRVHEALRTRHYSRRTEKAYVGWIRRYIVFHGRRHPREMGENEVTRFLTALAVDGKVSA